MESTTEKKLQKRDLNDISVTEVKTLLRRPCGFVCFHCSSIKAKTKDDLKFFFNIQRESRVYGRRKKPAVEKRGFQIKIERLKPVIEGKKMTFLRDFFTLFARI